MEKITTSSKAELPTHFLQLKTGVEKHRDAACTFTRTLFMSLEQIQQLPWKNVLLQSILQDVTRMQLDHGSSHWESQGPRLWKQLWIVRVKGQPPTSASLSSQHSPPVAPLQQELGEH